MSSMAKSRRETAAAMLARRKCQWLAIISNVGYLGGHPAGVAARRNVTG